MDGSATHSSLKIFAGACPLPVARDHQASACIRPNDSGQLLPLQLHTEYVLPPSGRIRFLAQLAIRHEDVRSGQGLLAYLVRHGGWERKVPNLD